MLRFDPFSDLDAVTRGLLSSQSGSDRSPRFMPMDLYKVDDHYVLTADLPGVDVGLGVQGDEAATGQVDESGIGCRADRKSVV